MLLLHYILMHDIEDTHQLGNTLYSISGILEYRNEVSCADNSEVAIEIFQIIF